MIFQVIFGAVMTVGGFYGHSIFSPVLFVEGLILLNIAIFSKKNKGLNHL